MKLRRKHFLIVILVLAGFCGTLFAAGNKKSSRAPEPKPAAEQAQPASEQAAEQTPAPAVQPDENRGLVEKAPGAGFEEEDFKPQVEEESTVWMIFKTLFVLGLMVAGFYYFFRFVTKKAGIQFMGQEVVQVLSIVPVGQNRYLQVVDLAGRILVLGIAENNINLLLEITDRDEKDRIRLMSSRSHPAQEIVFSEFLAKQIGRVTDFIQDRRGRKKPQAFTHENIFQEPQSGADLDYLKQQKNRLKNMDGWRDE